MIPQWGKADSVKKGHFYLSDGRSICGKTYLWQKRNKVVEHIELVNEIRFCHYCKKKLLQLTKGL